MEDDASTDYSLLGNISFKGVLQALVWTCVYMLFFIVYFAYKKYWVAVIVLVILKVIDYGTTQKNISTGAQ